MMCHGFSAYNAMHPQDAKKKRKECFGKETLMKGECTTCKDAIECIMSLYDQPQPSIVIYSADLLEEGRRHKP